MSQDDQGEMPPQGQTSDEPQPIEQPGQPAPRRISQVKRVIIFLAVVAFVLLVVASRYSARRAGGDPQIRQTLACWSCGHVWHEKMKASDGKVGPCPNCGKATVGLGYPCPNCKTPMVLNETRGLPPPTKCPKCSREVRHGD